MAPNGSAEKAGLRPNDILVSANGINIRNLGLEEAKSVLSSQPAEVTLNAFLPARFPILF